MKPAACTEYKCCVTYYLSYRQKEPTFVIVTARIADGKVGLKVCCMMMTIGKVQFEYPLHHVLNDCALRSGNSFALFELPPLNSSSSCHKYSTKLI